MIKATLRNRITLLMITSSLLLIVTFCFIQLYNQQENLATFNAYRANLSGPIIKNNIEAILKSKSKSTQQLNEYLDIGLNLIAETVGAQDGCVFDKDGAVLAATKTAKSDPVIAAILLQKWPTFEKLYDEGKISLPEINKTSRKLDLYVPLKINPKDPVTYAAKLTFSLGNVQQALAGVYWTMALAAIVIILANILLGYLISKTVVGPIKVLNDVTKIISKGDLTVRTSISTGDELEDLGATFNYMTEELIKMKERAENANPLTKLPGNIVIREEVEKRIRQGRKFAVIYCDLNSFKAFNDKYGISRGDDAIKLTADILKEAIKEKGNPDDFVGHEGGDDFILLTTFEKAQEIANFIINRFDSRIDALYDEEDSRNGYILSKNRDGSFAKFKIMGISLAGVSNEYRAINNYVEVTNIAAEVKHRVKIHEFSAFFMDQRKS